MYATDAAARTLADAAIAAGHDRFIAPELQLFFHLPFGDSEVLADQERAVELCVLRCAMPASAPWATPPRWCSRRKAR